MTNSAENDSRHFDSGMSENRKARLFLQIEELSLHTIPQMSEVGKYISLEKIEEHNLKSMKGVKMTNIAQFCLNIMLLTSNRHYLTYMFCLKGYISHRYIQ